MASRSRRRRPDLRRSWGHPVSEAVRRFQFRGEDRASHQKTEGTVACRRWTSRTTKRRSRSLARGTTSRALAGRRAATLADGSEDRKEWCPTVAACIQVNTCISRLHLARLAACVLDCAHPASQHSEPQLAEWLPPDGWDGQHAGWSRQLLAPDCSHAAQGAAARRRLRLGRLADLTQVARVLAWRLLLEPRSKPRIETERTRRR